jgi:multicomponent K+:H+ antiporter subunit G
VTDVPIWAEIVAAVLLGCGGILIALAAFGLLRFDNFFERMHPPTMGTTLGAGSVLVASMLVSSVLQGRPVVHEVLITLFIVMTAPVTAMVLVRAAIYRGKRR